MKAVDASISLPLLPGPARRLLALALLAAAAAAAAAALPAPGPTARRAEVQEDGNVVSVADAPPDAALSPSLTPYVISVVDVAPNAALWPPLPPLSPSPAFSAAPSFGPGVPSAPPAPPEPSAPPAPPAPPAPTPTQQRRCAPEDQLSDRVVRLERTWVCLTLSGNPAAPPQPASANAPVGAAPLASVRAAFDPPCDRFSLVQVSGSYRAFADQRGATLVSAASLGAASAGAKIWLSADGSFVFPSYTVIVAVVAGSVRAVAFDEGCTGCGERSGACGANTLEVSAGLSSCFVPRSTCVDTPQPDNPSANSCDLKVFFVWAGEDSRGAYMTSTSSRLSRFASYPAQAAQLWQQVASWASAAAQGGAQQTQQQP